MEIDVTGLESVMETRKLTLLNTSILTAYGTYRYEPLSLEQAKALLRDYQRNGWPIQSAIGHQSTAELLSDLLEFHVPANRSEFKQAVNDVAMVFKLCRRISEGSILTREEIERTGYEFGLLTRLS